MFQRLIFCPLNVCLFAQKQFEHIIRPAGVKRVCIENCSLDMEWKHFTQSIAWTSKPLSFSSNCSRRFTAISRAGKCWLLIYLGSKSEHLFIYGHWSLFHYLSSCLICHLPEWRLYVVKFVCKERVWPKKKCTHPRCGSSVKTCLESKFNFLSLDLELRG